MNSTAILACVFDPPTLENLQGHNPLCRRCVAYEEAFFVPIIHVFGGNIVFLNVCLELCSKISN